MRKYGKWLLVLGILAANPAWAYADGLLSGLRPSLPQTKTAQKEEDMKRAEEVMNALKQARVDGYDVRVEVRGDTVKLDGKVRNVNHRALAEQSCQNVAGIKRVLNNLKYVPPGDVQQTAGRYTDSALRPATYHVTDGGESGIEQVHFQKPGKRTKTPAPQQQATAQPKVTANAPAPGPKQQNSTAQPRITPPPVARTAQPKVTANAPAPGPKQQNSTAQPRITPPPVAPATQPKVTVNAPAPGPKQQDSTAQPWITPPPVARTPQPKVTANAPAPGPKQQDSTAQPWITPPPVARTPQPKVTETAPAPKLKPPAVPPEAPHVMKPVSAPKLELTRPLDMTASMMPQQQPAGPSNQQVAQEIASSLGEVGLVGYEIEVRYENGIAHLVGDVPSAQQIQAAGFAASRVPGVKTVKNDLKIGGAISQTGFRQGQAGYPMPQMMQGYPQGYPQVHRASMMGAPMGGGAPMGAPSPIGGAGNYSNPQLPSHAWPAYAQYPNSAAVSYPKQHSASAFPYIGPFYPYPQVPLGWREVSLQWDDGYWQLDFEQKKDAWYWLFAPRNWN
jgi:osmotically-inducible protein OsmY